ncbi:methylmalonyl-CoA epimerase [Chryseomicrobium aureum]|uniref:methylmalonyl-CoA epimerase n=1 Tax=Chryseomicrobium aureum TaxID=1441723 RepID=UPI0019561D66|nr:methylmalonyl-CoA epimerase [Chryseomicrobium aureum]MBM7705679.1 methylmalonyl-CoA/ethylmalonyl-CoA epimerase [Chryseomicrobium aureum]
MKKVDHIGIAVHSIDEALPYYIETLGLPLLKVEEVQSEQVKVAFLDAGNLKLELLEPLSESSAIHGFLEKKGPGMHHIAFGVESIQARLNDLKDNGVRLIQEQPKVGAGGALVAFIHPKSSHGVLYELCEKQSEAKN